MTFTQVLQTAANTYERDGQKGDVNKLHKGIVNILDTAYTRIERGDSGEYMSGNKLRSSQVVVAICIAWELANPNQIPYNYEV